MENFTRQLAMCAVMVLTFNFSSPAVASGYTNNGTIKYMQQAYGGWLFSLTGSNSNPDQCQHNKILLTGTSPQFDQIYSMLLAAYLAKKPVNIYVSGCHSAGYKQFNFIFTDWNNE